MRRGGVRCALLCVILLACVACAAPQPTPQIIIITATFAPLTDVTAQVLPAVNQPPPTPTFANLFPPPVATYTLFAVPAAPLSLPTPNPTRPFSADAQASAHLVQSGDTLLGIAVRYNTTVETLLALNTETLPNPDLLAVGQSIALPDQPLLVGGDFKIIPDARLVRGPGAAAFDVTAFVAQQSGYIRSASDVIDGTTYNAAEIVQRVALEFSVDARLLLALLEYRSQWLSNPAPPPDQRQYPMGITEYPEGVGRRGLYRQLSWAANELNRGYYDWKLRGRTVIEFADGARILLAPTLNAATVGVQSLFSRTDSPQAWQANVGPPGLYRTYYQYFGDPFANALEPLVPPNLRQPDLALPFGPGEVWFFTGGPHGGWAGGSAWAAVDFAPPDVPNGNPCYVSAYFVTAVADGVIARSGEGAVVLDLDGDGDESTGWTIFYLHLATQDRAPQGAQVRAGDVIGRASCEGGFSNATHLHLARRYNGEWIPVSCELCDANTPRPNFVLGGWAFYGYAGQEYQGYAMRDGLRRLAEQGRASDDNWLSW
jgi:LasA protease